jgi:PAS domain S-box/diguanylate cyclase (GGDEF) domain
MYHFGDKYFMSEENRDNELQSLRAENLQLRRQILEFQNVCTEYGSDSALFLSGPMVLFKWSTEPGWPVNYVSPNVRDLLGYTQDQFLLEGLDYSSLVHPDDLDRVVSEAKANIASASTSFTHAPYRIRHSDGRMRWLLDHTVIVPDAEGVPVWFVGYILDITERIRMEERLRRSEERWQFALEGNRDGVWDWNVNTNKVFFSRRWKEMIGYGDHELASAFGEWDKRLHPEDRERVYADLDAHMRGETPYYETAFRLQAKDGRWVWIQARAKTMERDAEGRPLRVIGTHTDITQEKRTEEDLKRSQVRLAMAQQLARLGSWAWNKDSGEIYWSEEVFRIFERDPAQGPPDYDEYMSYHHPEDKAAIEQSIARSLETEGEYDLEHRVMLPSGRIKYVHGAGRVDYDPKGRPTGLFGTVQDITDRKAAERKLQSFAERIALASDAGGVGIWEWNLATDELTWDQRMYGLYAVKADEFSGLYEAWTARLHPDDRDMVETSLKEALDADKEWHCRFRVRLPDGDVRHVQAAARAVRDTRGRLDRVFGINLNVTESVLAQSQLEQLAHHDSLTGLLNRGRFMELAAQELERVRRYPHHVSLIMFDADRFKVVNDTYGHGVGDLVLKRIADTACAALRDVDILGRLGGEEFAVLLPETDMEGALLVAERIRASIEAESVLLEQGDRVRFTVSLGVAGNSPGGLPLDNLLQAADKALYKAKENGRNRVERG